MLRKECVKQTAYGEYVERGVVAYFAEMDNNFTLQELAAKLGLKVTPSFRRRVWTLERQGKIVACSFVGEDMRMHLCYCKPAGTPPDQEIPF